MKNHPEIHHLMLPAQEGDALSLLQTADHGHDLFVEMRWARVPSTAIEGALIALHKRMEASGYMLNVVLPEGAGPTDVEKLADAGLSPSYSVDAANDFIDVARHLERVHFTVEWRSAFETRTHALHGKRQRRAGAAARC
jgi:hypothetical protein